MSSPDKSLMILGALEEFVPLVELAASRGIRTVVVDGNKNAPAKLASLARGGAAYDADVRAIHTIAAIAKAEGVSAITTAYSDLLLECMVKIAWEAHLPCHLLPTQLMYYRDKRVMNALYERLGIGTPISAVLTDPASVKAAEDLRFPVIVKPTDLYGSRGLTICGSAEEVMAAFSKCGQDFGCRTVLVEEYNPDHEFNVQAWVRHGRVHILGIADREKTPHDTVSIPLSTRNVYPSRLFERVYPEALKALSEYIIATGQKEGPLAMQFFWSPERGLSAGETAARFLGYEHELITFTTGVSVEELLLDAAFFDDELDSRLAACDPRGRGSAAVLYFHGRDGKIADLSSALAIAAREDVQYGRIFYEKGERIGSPQRMPYVARYDIVCPDRETCDTITEEIFETMAVRGEDGQDLLYPNRIGDYSDVS